MVRRSDHSRAELTELALQAAEQLVDEQGIEQLSTRKIAKEIGYSAGTLYLIFKNLDDLCWHINARTMGQLNQRFDQDPAINNEKTNPARKLQLIGYHYLEFAAKYPNRWSLMFEHRAAHEAEEPAWLNEAIEQLFHQVEQPLQTLCPKLSPEQRRLSVRSLWSGVHGIAALNQQGKLFLPQDVEPKQLLDDLLQHYLTSLTQETQS